MKFMLLFAGGSPNLTISAPESEEKQNQMKRWGDWMVGLAKKGVLEAGCPFLDRGKVVSRDGIAEFHKSDDDYSGYVILNVPTEQNAAEIARTAPHIVFGGTAVVRPCAEIPKS
jgi:hypothetical protein